ncbi:DUF72 domain-containing protein [Rhodococcus maanshanensis]|uniref:Uncharacterized conserved protein YecE, DUF72 family n=1 Tax=Rhodococcus maanshanensis TaxID=183556 RepID=A0A1H7WL57_9NOCA|nr:DUF72 domain-containing protein [Rhodococcus maanshanensis]SEM22094.1 Uncharacterized conserved protein YecE, DUF72 family [Rhodococcus maanshanensis]
MAEVRIGISGWTYPGWRGDFYPAGLVHRRELAYAAARMASIEINGSFYALQTPESFARWRDETPDGFVFAVKGGRFITHMKRLRDVDTALANFFASGPLALHAKLGPILWQLPPTLAFDPDRVAGFLAALPRTTTDAAELAARHDDKVPEDSALTVADAPRPVRHALEARHVSFGDPEAVALIEQNDVALVVSDSAGRYPMFDRSTSDFTYVRLHGDTELYASGYSDRALDGWATRIGGWRADGLDVFVYFDNDEHGRAPFDAIALRHRLGPG